MIETRLQSYDNAGEWAEAIADEVAAIIDDGLKARDRALLAFPGGQTPAPAFDRLAARPLAWGKVTILPTDDRLVPADDPRSNIAAITRIFLPLDARIVPPADGGGPQGQAGDDADARLGALPWPPDLVWLGMGADGHTASIFPGPDLESALRSERRAIGLVPDPLPREAPVARVTLTRSAILSARTILIAIAGAEKRGVLEQAMSEGAEGVLPIGRVLARAAQPISVHWLSQ